MREPSSPKRLVGALWDVEALGRNPGKEVGGRSPNRESRVKSLSTGAFTRFNGPTWSLHPSKMRLLPKIKGSWTHFERITETPGTDPEAQVFPRSSCSRGPPGDARIGVRPANHSLHLGGTRLGSQMGMGQNYITRNWTAGFSLWFHLPGQGILDACFCPTAK